MNNSEFIEELLLELSYRSDEGYPMLNKTTHISLLSEILDDWDMSEIKNNLINSLMEAGAEDLETHTHKGGGIYVKKGDEENDKAQKFTSDGNNKYTPISDDAAEKMKGKAGEAGEKAAADTPQNQKSNPTDPDSGDGDEEKKATGFDGSTPDGLEYILSLGKNDPAYKAAVAAGRIEDDVNADGKKLPKALDSTELGKVLSKTGDTDVKNTMLSAGYEGYEKETGTKPAPGGSASAFNEIVSGELILLLEKNPDMTEAELADYSHKRFGNTTLGKEQKETTQLGKNDDIEKRRLAARGNSKSHARPQFPEQHKQVMQERATYSKSRVAAASALKKHKATQERIKNLKSNGLFGEKTQTHPFYGAGASIDAQIDMVNNTKGVVYLPNGTPIGKDDLNKFIKAGGKGMNPSDTATFVTDDKGNLLVQFHSDKTRTSDLQDNSTLKAEEAFYDSYIDKSSLSEEDKVACKKINKEYSAKMNAIEVKYNNQSVAIASNLLKLDRTKLEKIIEEEDGTLVQNMNDSLFGVAKRKRGEFTEVSKQYIEYLPKDTEVADLTNIQKAEMLYKYAEDGGTLVDSIVKSINKVGLQYKNENPDAIGLDVKKLLSGQRKEVVEMQREKIRTMNNFTADIDGVGVGAGTLMEAEENIRGFHFGIMDYPPKGYEEGNPSSITGTALDINMGGVVVSGEVLRGCLGVENTTEFKQKFKLKEEEDLTYDSNKKDKDGNNLGNVTGKKVFTYIVDGNGGKKEIGFKSYRSKEGAAGKTTNTMTYSTDMQKCFKSKQ